MQNNLEAGHPRLAEIAKFSAPSRCPARHSLHIFLDQRAFKFDHTHHHLLAAIVGQFYPLYQRTTNLLARKRRLPPPQVVVPIFATFFWRKGGKPRT